MAEEAARSGKSQKHVSTACTNCRKRKVKCDGKEPSCSNCLLFKQACTYTHGEDKRKQSSRKIIDSLTARVKTLEELLQHYGIAIPPRDDDSLNQRPDQQGLGLSDSEPNFTPVTKNSEFNPATSLGLSQLSNLVSPLDKSNTVQGKSHILAKEAVTSTQTGWEQYAHDNSRDNNRAAFVVPPTGNVGFNISNDPTRHGSGFQGTTFRNSEIAQPFTGGQSYFPKQREAPNNLQGKDSYNLYNVRPELQQRKASTPSWQDDKWTPQSTINSLRDESASPKEVSADDDIVDQLAARMGTFQIAEDGELRYFGATSTLHIVHNGKSSLFKASARSMRQSGEMALKQAGLVHTVNPEIEHHLEKLYFAWEDPSIHIVDEEMYYQEQDKWKAGHDSTSFYSETLRNAILAVGANLSSRPTPGLSQSATEFYQLRAKAHLEVELDAPTVATIQALVIMSATEAAATRDSRGWVYSGMAVRLCADLGLNLDLSEQVRAGIITAREANGRRITLWGTFIHDNMWSLYVGRPMGASIKEVTVSRLQEDNTFEGRQKLWRPVLDAADNTYPVNFRGIPESLENCTDSFVTLADIMCRMGRVLYSGKSLSEEELGIFAAEMREEFARWKNDLAAELRIDVNQNDVIYLPHVLVLHMQFHVLSIFTHRPLFSETGRAYPPTTNSPSPLARQACTISAQSIVSILKVYRRQHTLRRCNVQVVHLVFSACLILIYNTCTSVGVEAERAMADLQTCCEAFQELGHAYKNALRALEVIICIKREWQAKAQVQQQRTKRSSSPQPSDDNEDEQRKKRAAYARLEEQHESFWPVEAGNSTLLGMHTPWGFLDDMNFSLGMNSEVLGTGLSEFDPFAGGSFDYAAMNAPDTQGQNDTSR